MGESSQSFTGWVLWRVYGAFTLVAIGMVVALVVFGPLVDRSVVLFVASAWVGVTLYGLYTRWRSVSVGER